MEKIEKERILQQLVDKLADEEISQRQFAKVINYDPSQINKLLTGKAPLTDRFLRRVQSYLKGEKREWKKRQYMKRTLQESTSTENSRVRSLQ